MRGAFSPFLFLFVSKKGTFYLSVNVFSTKVLNGDTVFLLLLMETGPPFYVVIRATERSRRLQCKGSTYLHFSVIFKTLSIGPAPGIEPATSHSAVKRSILTELILPRLKFLSVELFTSPLRLKIP